MLRNSFYYKTPQDELPPHAPQRWWRKPFHRLLIAQSSIRAFLSTARRRFSENPSTRERQMSLLVLFATESGPDKASWDLFLGLQVGKE